MHKVTIYNIKIDNVTMSEALSSIVKFCKSGKKGYVVTPNVDHVVRYQKDTKFKKVYDEASFVFADGSPIVKLSKMHKKPIKERITGVELFHKLLPLSAKENLSVFLLGGREEVNQKAYLKAKKDNPKLKIAGSYSPKFGFEKDPAETKKIIEMINKTKPNILFLCLSTPKQEYWINENLQKLNINLGLCVGASMDFYVGEFKRSPTLMQNIGMEWVWRMMLEPKRLGKRYLVDDLVPFIKLNFKEFKK